MNYATLKDVRDYLRLDADQTGDDALLTDFIVRSVGQIDRYCKRRFDVRCATLKFDSPNKFMDLFGVAYSHLAAYDFRNYDLKLRLDDDLLALHTLINGDGSTIPNDAYWLEPNNEYPKNRITLKPDQQSIVNSLFDPFGYGTGNQKQAISLTGLWGYHDKYQEAWVDTMDAVKDNPLLDGATTLTVTDVDGIAGDSRTVRIQAGNMIRFGNADGAEFTFVLSTNAVANTALILRGYNGTTAVEQAKDTKIFVYRPMENIVSACVRLAAWRYRQKDADIFDKTAILGSGFKVIPEAMPTDVASLLPHPKVDAW